MPSSCLRVRFGFVLARCRFRYVDRIISDYLFAVLVELRFLLFAVAGHVVDCTDLDGEV